MDEGSLLIGPLGRAAEAGEHQIEQGERTPKVPEGSQAPSTRHANRRSHRDPSFRSEWPRRMAALDPGCRLCDHRLTPTTQASAPKQGRAQGRIKARFRPPDGAATR